MRCYSLIPTEFSLFLLLGYKHDIEAGIEFVRLNPIMYPSTSVILKLIPCIFLCYREITAEGSSLQTASSANSPLPNDYRTSFGAFNLGSAETILRRTRMPEDCFLHGRGLGPDSGFEPGNLMSRTQALGSFQNKPTLFFDNVLRNHLGVFSIPAN